MNPLNLALYLDRVRVWWDGVPGDQRKSFYPADEIRDATELPRSALSEVLELAGWHVAERAVWVNGRPARRVFCAPPGSKVPYQPLGRPPLVPPELFGLPPHDPFRPWSVNRQSRGEQHHERSEQSAGSNRPSHE